MSFKISFKSPECQTVMEVRRQRIPESRSRHREAAVCTSKSGARYSQAHSGTGRAQCPAWHILADHGAHVDWCIIGVQGLVKEAHQFVADSLVDQQPVQHLECWSDMATSVTLDVINVARNGNQ